MKKLKNILTNKRAMNLLFIFVCVVYALVLCRGILFKYVSPFELFSPDRYEYIGYNPIPFYGSGLDFRLDTIINAFLFMPFGFLLSMKSRKNMKSLLLIFIPLLASIILESLQYAFRLGAADITDVIMNTVGSCLGFLMYLVSFIIFDDRADKLYTYTMSAVAVVALVLLY